jgi:xanthine dehydrogenase accessory factor
VRAIAEVARRAANGEAVALATVIETIGSAPAESAMRMVVGPSGRLAGTVGGGRVEATVIERGREALRTGRHEILSFTLDDDLADEGGLLCGGTVRILVERVDPPAAWAARAIELHTGGGRAALLAKLGDRVAHEVVEGDAAGPFLGSEEPRLEGDLFVEPLLAPRCIVVGAGHVGRAVAAVARESGLLVTAVEDRETEASRVAADAVICAPLEEGLASAAPGASDFVVVTTRAHGLDLRCVRAALLTKARYVGLLASRKKAEVIRAALAKEGVDATRLHAPVGLDLQAKSAGEIAVSIVAQLIKVRRLGRGDR